jgi:RHS repeat-associated protein
VFAYNLADQVTAAQLNVSNIWSVHPTPTIVYDANGNRTSFGAYGTTDTYATNLLNQYTSRTPAPPSYTPSYDNNGNMTTALDGSFYTYDAQSRVTTASKNGLTVTFIYDALNRVVTRSFSDGRRYDNIWDGWNLILTYDGSNNWIVAPTHGPNGIEYEYNTTTLTAEMIFKDASGSTTHLGNADTGQLDEWYRYDLDGNPLIYAPDGTSRTASAYDIRHLFTGQQWYSDLGLYDLRNRFYSPDIGRFLQPDPIGFRGGRNLYRYCRNNPLKRRDPFGLEDNKQDYATVPRVYVPGDPVPSSIGNLGLTGFPPGEFGWPGTPWANDPFVWPNSPEFKSHFMIGGDLNDEPSSQPAPAAAPAPSSLPAQSPQQSAPDLLTITVVTAIENGPESGLKSYQWATVNVFGEITSQPARADGNRL